MLRIAIIFRVNTKVMTQIMGLAVGIGISVTIVSDPEITLNSLKNNMSEDRDE